MWHAETGDRTFTGTFGALLASVLERMLEEYEDIPEHFNLGFTAFDQLTFSQKIATFHQTAFALLLEEVPTPKLYAYNEAFVAGIFEELKGDLDYEIDMEGEFDESYDSKFYRRLVISVANEMGYNEADSEMDFEPLTIDCENYDEWHDMADMLAEQILWDNDFTMVDEVLDMPREQRMQVESVSGFGEDYFTAFPDDPSDEETGKLIEELRVFLRRYSKRE